MQPSEYKRCVRCCGSMHETPRQCWCIQLGQVIRLPPPQSVPPLPFPEIGLGWFRIYIYTFFFFLAVELLSLRRWLIWYWAHDVAFFVLCTAAATRIMSLDWLTTIQPARSSPDPPPGGASQAARSLLYPLLVYFPSPYCSCSQLANRCCAVTAHVTMATHVSMATNPPTIVFPWIPMLPW